MPYMKGKTPLLLAILSLLFIAACTSPCPPGTTMGPDGICCEGEDGICDAQDTDTEPAITDADADGADTSDASDDSDGEESDSTGETDESQTAETETLAPVSETDDDSTEDADESETAVGPAEPAEAEETHATTLKAMKDLYSEKVESYTFRYGENQYAVRGDRLKITLDDPDYKRNIELPDGAFANLFYFDVIYVHLPTKNATAYCEGYDTDLRRQCESLEISDIPLEIDYSDYQIALPHEWLIQFYTNSTVEDVQAGKYYIRNREVTRFNLEGYEVNIDPRNGLPVQIIDAQGQIDYPDLVINSVFENEMRHRTYTDTI